MHFFSVCAVRSGAKKPPTPIEFNPSDPLHAEFIYSAATLRATMYGIPGSLGDIQYAATVASAVLVERFRCVYVCVCVCLQWFQWFFFVTDYSVVQAHLFLSSFCLFLEACSTHSDQNICFFDRRPQEGVKIAATDEEAKAEAAMPVDIDVQAAEILK